MGSLCANTVLVKLVTKFLGIPLLSFIFPSSTEGRLKRKLLHWLFSILWKTNTSVSPCALFRGQQESYEPPKFSSVSFEVGRRKLGRHNFDQIYVE